VRKRNVLFGYVAIVAFASATLFHATAVVVYNLPNGDARRTMQHYLAFYNGPQTRQGWSLFAPSLDRFNQHVLVRGKMNDGAATAWYDVTQFFNTERAQWRLTPEWALSEGLDHSVSLAESTGKLRRARGVYEIGRTSAMVLERASPSANFAKMQIEIQRRSVPAIGVRSALQVDNLRFDWISVPGVGSL
jgi:hypothetical protein